MSDPKPNMKLLKRVLAKIDEHPELHDQRAYATKTACGTAHCIAGWIAVLTGHKPDVKHGGIVTVGGRSVRILATEKAGLTHDEAGELFSSYNKRTDIDKIIAEIGERAKKFEVMA